MNILFTYITPFHPDRGGIGRITDSLTREFLKRGHQVYYLIYDSSVTEKHVYPYPVPLEYFPSRLLLSKENLEFYHCFLEKKKINIVINQSGNFSDSFLYLNKGESSVKIISVLHSAPSVAYNSIWHEIYPLRNKFFIEKLKRIARMVLYPRIKYRYRKSRINQFKKMLPLTDYICTLSPNFFQEISSYCSGYENKYIAIPNPNTYLEEQLKIIKTIKKRPQVLYSGLLVQNKRVDRLIRVWRSLEKDYPDWKLIILGDGDANYVDTLKELASKCHNISFEGFQKPLSYYLNSSILCLPSNYEGWGMAITEAMQCGTVPVVFDSFASARDIIEHGRNGLLISPFNLHELECALRLLMTNNELRKEMAENARIDVKRFSIDRVCSMWEKLFDNILINENLSTIENK